MLLRTLLKRDISSSSLSEIPKLGVKTYKAQGVTRRERRREKLTGEKRAMSIFFFYFFSTNLPL